MKADPSPSLLFPKLALLLCMGLAVTVCGAEPLWEGTAFQPTVRSQLSSSLLNVNDSYDVRVPLVQGPGLDHPFESWKVFKSSLLEAFSPGDKRRALIQYAHQDEQADYSMETNFFAGYDYRWDDPGRYGFLYKGLRVNSEVNGRFRFRATWWNGRFYGDTGAALGSPLVDGTSNLSSNRKLVDNVNGEISYSGKHLTAALGRGKFQIGNSISGSLVLSERVNDYDFLLLEERFGAFRFSFAHGTLIADSLGLDGSLPAKYFALHQMSYQLKDWLELYLGETVIYGNQLDLSYILPAYFWRTGKYDLQDRDNLLIYAGANIQPSEELTIYLNGALDELTYNKFYTNWWGNKYALQAGASLFLPSLALSGDGDPRCTLEFTAVRPWTYTHYANVSMYSHDQRPLGYAKGSNLFDLSAELNLPLPAKLRWDSQISFTWQGSEGNDWRLNYKDHFPPEIVGSAEADWLEGETGFSCLWQSSLRWEIMAHHAFLLGHRSELADAPGHQFFACWQASF
ncbi:MAG: hypothetical protein K0B87_08680 [Candidatus Syntrophosphaera sp.]|nr:hypothetical protein [Candidatus Syntrophosphaera sp.]